MRAWSTLTNRPNSCAVPGYGALADAFYYVGANGERNWVSPVDAIVERDEKVVSSKLRDAEGHELVYTGMSKMSKSKITVSTRRLWLNVTALTRYVCS